VGLFFRPRRPLLLLAAGAASTTARPHQQQSERPEAETDTTAALERLTRLHAAAALSDEEFAAAKARVLRM
jgi:hypothetical protein